MAHRSEEKDMPFQPDTRLVGRICRAHVKCLHPSAKAHTFDATSPPTLVVGRAARASKTHLAHIGGMMSVGHAPAGDCHGPVAVGASHCAVGSVVS